MLLVALRMAIGWQFLYEGVWKLDTMDTADPWSAEGYLKNAKGPLRSHFRNLTGDPNDLQWADYDYLTNRWNEWHERFVDHYQLSEKQRGQLDILLNGREEYAAALERLPDRVEFRGSLGRALKFDADRKRLIVPGDWHMLPQERERALRLVTVVPEDEASRLSEQERRQNKLARAYQEAVQTVYARQRRLPYKKRLAATLKGDPQWIGPAYSDAEGDVVEKRMGDVELYRRQIERYERNLAFARQSFEHEHLEKQWQELQQLRSRVVGPSKALDADLMHDARKLLTARQLARGPVPTPWEPIDFINWMTIAALCVLGLLLISGLFSRLAGVAGAGLLMSFYLAMPPWPSVPGFQELPGPEHSYIVDKNLIEVCALLAIAFLPTGKWFGLDAVFAGLRARRKAARLQRLAQVAQTKHAVADSQPQRSKDESTYGIENTAASSAN